jgi:ABC-type phosphate transport system substrate-binding protein
VPHKAEIEQLVGVEITMFASSSTRGLADLVQGRADIAMLAEPLEAAALAANAKQPELINPADYVGRHVGDAVVQFIVHPSNPIQKLTRAQLAGLYSGEIKNWSEIGGTMENPGPVCLRCMGLDDLEFLPAGDALLSRRVKAKSTRFAIVVRFSRSRRRYERQGLLVEPQALSDVQRELEAQRRGDPTG